jgi:ribonuclease HI
MAIELFCDASIDESKQWAGIAVVREGALAASDVVRCGDSNEAELLAIIRALQLSRASQWEEVFIYTDSLQAIRVLDNQKTTPQLARLGQAARQLAEQFGQVKYTERSNIRQAHTLARQMIRAWSAGQKEEPTWWPNGDGPSPGGRIWHPAALDKAN